MENSGCPRWCVGSHRPDDQHYSGPTKLGGLLAELLQSPGDDEVYLSLLNQSDGTGHFQIPMSVVPLIATTALRLTAARRHGIVA